MPLQGFAAPCPPSGYRNSCTLAVPVPVKWVDDPVRVLGYGFHEASEAVRARDLLTSLFGLGEGDASVGDLAGNGVVLAVRAREDKLPLVTEVLAQHGGEPLVDVDERWTRARGA
jgi:hypothetical protein